MFTKLVILDRDGTINYDSDNYIKSQEEWEPLPGSVDAIARLNHAGWHVVVATNQSGLGRGLYDVATLNAMHDKMNRLLGQAGGRVDAIFFCPHTPEEACSCRKPLPGMFEQISERYGMSLKGVPMVGDSLVDMQAAAAAQCEPHLVLTGKGEQWRGRPLSEAYPSHTRIHDDLSAFVDNLVGAHNEPQLFRQPSRNI
jgi:D-glycero-D-manno-heptose 1,7-bisphosphate phosphatase